MADPFVGKMSYFKVVSGTMKADSQVFNSTSGQNEKVGKLFFIRGNKQTETPAIGAGDIGFVSKLSSTATAIRCAPPAKTSGCPASTSPPPPTP